MISKKLMTLALLLIPVFMYGQDTIYVDQYGSITKSKLLGTTYRLKSADSTVNNGKIEREYYLSGKLKSVCHLVTVLNEKTKKKENQREGKFRLWYESGVLRREIDYHHNKIDGNLTTYWENGKIKRHDLYDEGKSQEGKCYTENGAETTYYPFEIMPEFTGGEKVLLLVISRSLRYPVDAQEAGISGKVLVHFVIDKEGQVTDISIKHRLYPSMDEEAMRVVSTLPRWAPGEQDGEKVPVRYTLPITFNLTRDTRNNESPNMWH